MNSFAIGLKLRNNLYRLIESSGSKNIEKVNGKMLGKNEQKKNHFEEGKFYAPNTEQCVADAEIHILDADNTDYTSSIFPVHG